MLRIENRERTASRHRGSAVYVMALVLGGAAGCGSGDLGEFGAPEPTATREEPLISATWTAEGPAPMKMGQSNTYPFDQNNPVAGAVHALAPHPTNPNILYAGAVGGGVWRTDNALALNPTWRPLTDFMPSLNIGALALDPTNPQVVVAGTGRWSASGNDGAAQGHVLISRNGGSSWTARTIPGWEGQKMSGVAVRGNTVLAAAVDSMGLARSTDGGTTWTRISEGAGTGLPYGPIDRLAPDRQNRNRFYLTISRVGVFRSDDLGATWVNISQTDPTLDDAVRNQARAVLVSTCNDGRVYVAVNQENGQMDSPVIYVGYSWDQGRTWHAMEQPGVMARGSAFQHFTLGADPINSSFVYVAGIGDWRRGTPGIPVGSGQWTNLAYDGTPHYSYPHADARDMQFDANNDLIESGDGGVFKRPRPRETTGDYYSLAGNLQTAEAHSVAYDNNTHTLLVGTQDNGTPMQNGASQLAWNLGGWGDGGDVQVDTLSRPGYSVRYWSSQVLWGFTRGTYDSNNVQIEAVGPLLQLQDGTFFSTGQWVTPVGLNKLNPRRMLIAGWDNVYESSDQGDHLRSMQAAGGASDVAYGHRSNADVIYAANGGVYVRLTATAPLAQTAALFPSGDAFGVALDVLDYRRAYVLGQWGHVFVTPDAGNGWTEITGNLMSFNPGRLRKIVFIPGPNGSPSRVVVGADRGVYAAATNALTNWQQVGSNLPLAVVDDMQYVPEQDLLAISTFGRGAFSARGLGGGATRAPIARCRNVFVDAGSACTAAVTAGQINNGSSDPDGDPIVCSLSGATGPFAVGSTQVSLSCADTHGAVGMCTANVRVGVGDNRACCPAGTNVIVGTSGNDTLNGTSGSDCILGLGGNDTINGNGGGDYLSGGAGNDVINGGAGNDLISGGLGDDRIDGGPDTDACSAGPGADILLNCE